MFCSLKMVIHPLHDIIPATTHYLFSCNHQQRFWRKTCTSSILYLPIMIFDNCCINRIRLSKDGDHLRKTCFSPLCQVIGSIVLSIFPSIWRLIIASMVAQTDNQWRLRQLSTSKWPWLTHFHVHEFKNSSPETNAKQFDAISFLFFISDQQYGHGR